MALSFGPTQQSGNMQPNVIGPAPPPQPMGGAASPPPLNVGAGTAQAMSPLVQALIKAKLKRTLAGQLPGTTGLPPAAAPGYFSPASAAAAPMQVNPLSLGGTPPGVPGQPSQ